MHKFKRVFENFLDSIRYGRAKVNLSSGATSPTLVPTDSEVPTTARSISMPCKKKLRHTLRKALRKLGLKPPKHKHTVSQQPTPETHPPPASKDTFGGVRRIRDEEVVELALDVASKGSQIPKSILADGSHVRVVKRAHGFNNLVFIVQYSESLKVCVRVPACAWKGAWTKQDAVAMRTSALSMRYIKRHTSCPIPDVITYDTTFDNAIRAPHTILLHVEGRAVEELWFDQDGPIPLEDKRQNILRSLAHATAQLRSLTFGQMGALQFATDDDDNPTIGPPSLMSYGASRTPDFLEFVKEAMSHPSSRSDTFVRARLEEWKQMVFKGRLGETERNQALGTYRLFSMLLDEFPFPAADEPEKFILAHPDFDMQNILADEYGNVTAIIDWDRVDSRPRYMGWCGPPYFLSMDWDSEFTYAWPHLHACEMPPLDYDRFRADYARYLSEACGEEGDCKYAAKAHLFDRIVEALGRTAVMDGLLQKVVAHVLPRVDAGMVRQCIGAGALAPESEEIIRAGLRRLLEC